MIHTKELRFGNKVQTKQGEVITIQQILCETIISESKIVVKKGSVNITEPPDQADFIFELNEVVKEVDCEEIYPITLTQGLLKICGFRNYCREEWIFTINNSHIDFIFVDGILRLKCMAESLSNIRYVHQLQNFLFTIGEYELEIEFAENAE